MIYLIEDKDEQEITINKVGYTDNFYQRMYMYKDHHSNVKIRGVMRGTYMEEQILHKYLDLKGLRCGYLREWYNKCPEVSDIFKDHDLTFKKVGKYLWDNRNTAFTKKELEKDDDWYNYYKKLERIYS